MVHMKAADRRRGKEVVEGKRDAVERRRRKSGKSARKGGKMYEECKLA